MYKTTMKSSPRLEIVQNIKTGNKENLLIKAAQLHGHYCPGLAMGVMASVYAMNYINAFSDGLEDILAITETNNCFSDGVQFVTGCSFGNNALIFKDLGKTAFTLTKRDGNGIRLVSKAESQEEIRKVCPEFSEVYQQLVANKDHSDEIKARYKKLGVKRAFGTLNIDINKLFDIQNVNVEIPEYAPSHESFNCDVCGESTMSTRTFKKNNKIICLTCSGEKINTLTGHGII